MWFRRAPKISYTCILYVLRLLVAPSEDGGGPGWSSSNRKVPKRAYTTSAFPTPLNVNKRHWPIEVLDSRSYIYKSRVEKPYRIIILWIPSLRWGATQPQNSSQGSKGLLNKFINPYQP